MPGHPSAAGRLPRRREQPSWQVPNGKAEAESSRSELPSSGVNPWPAIARALGGKRGPRASVPTRDRVTVAAVQMEFELVNSGAQYADKVYSLARQAVEQGAQFVTLPEYSWTPLIGMLPGIRDLAVGAHGGLEGAAKELGGGASLADIFRTVAPAVERAFVETGQGVARALGIYLMSGRQTSASSPRSPPRSPARRYGCPRNR